MKDTKQINGLREPQRCRSDKCEIPAHYGVGVRTIENWIEWGIIVAQRKGKRLERRGRI